ncbi:MAG: toll/interleukin-1 receptor domain-containing protein [Bacteroidales bacterium]|nr:toll/interleukin-1 receptor domain-containing protein [Bacteroidales bacterium]
MNYDVFISYSRRDSEWAEKICGALTRAGLTFFIDKQEIKGGSEFTDDIARAIDGSTVFVLVASKSAYASKFVNAEFLYAFNHKRSGTIIPYLVDSSPMPQNLELLMGPMNQLNSRDHSIEPVLVDAVKYAIAHPEAGTVSGRKVMKKWQKWGIGSAVALILAALIVFALNQVSSKSSAMHDLSRFEAYLHQSDSLVIAADRMKDAANTLETTGEQIASLKQALLCLDSSEAVRKDYTGSEFVALFNQDASSRREAVQSRLDSMFRAWSYFAKESYDLYRMTKRESEAKNALQCIDLALSIHPDSEMETIKNKLSI